MTNSTDAAPDPAARPAEQLRGRVAVIDLLVRYFGAVDDDQLDSAVVESTFTHNARLVRPNGSAMTGHQQILVEQLRSFARFRATHHVITDHAIDFDGDLARVRANMTAMHLWLPTEGDPHALETYFLAGGVLHATARRTEAGWRLRELALCAVWRTGAGFTSMLKTGTPAPATP